VKIHDISGFLGMSLGVLERLYGKHRIPPSKIDMAVASASLSQTEA